MNRTDRLLAIILELQSRGKQRAEDLAATFEISKRTVYRDVLALCEAGVPIISVPGYGYALSEDYFLPPLRFSADEGAMLLLGSDVMSDYFDGEYKAAAQAAARKIAAVLSTQLREDVQHVQDSIRFVALSTQDKNPEERLRLQQIRRAIFRRQTIQFTYFAKSREEASEVTTKRNADPYALLHVSQNWLLVAYCHLRKELRNFRLSRMEHLRVLPQTFERDSSFLLEDYLKRQRMASDEIPILVRVRIDREIMRWAQENYLFFKMDQVEDADGLIITFRVRNERDILGWVLQWGRHAQVLEPDWLRAKVVDEALAIAKNHNVEREPASAD